MCSLKTHDNIIFSIVSNECEHDSLYVNKVKSINKINPQSCNRNVSKGKSSMFKFEQQGTRTTSTLFWCLTSYKVITK